MATVASALKLSLFGISPDEATFARRGFAQATESRRLQLERSGRFFLAGYHLALRHGLVAVLAAALDTMEAPVRGFAYEGAAMALALTDAFAPWREPRATAFATGPGASHLYMIHVGIGWAWARLRRDPQPLRARSDPLLGWLSLDGYGFHEGYFHCASIPEGLLLRHRLRGYAARAFDQGLGRSLWFSCGADPAAVDQVVRRFSPERHADLWSGIGLASAYAGATDAESLRRLVELSGIHRPFLSLGAAFAAKARQRAGNPTPHTDRASLAFSGMTAEAAAAATDEALRELPADGEEPAYEVWRRRTCQLLTGR